MFGSLLSFLRRRTAAASAAEVPQGRTVTIVVHGGIGNQMFHYAHGLALARRLGATLRVAFDRRQRDYALDRFGIALDPPLKGVDLHDVVDYSAHRPGREWPDFEEIERSGARHARVTGYFESEEFFRPVADEIRRTFRVESRRPAGCENRTVVGVHVRRGDFLGTYEHDLCRPAYYHQSMTRMRSLVENPRFIIVSDDPDWCRREFAQEPDVEVMDGMSRDAALATLAGCDAFILSNSTFGWWAAWLSERTPVIAPNPFVRGTAWNIVPSRWLRHPAGGVPEASTVIGLVFVVGAENADRLPELISAADAHFLAGCTVEYLVFMAARPTVHSRRPVHFFDGSVPSRSEELRRFDYLFFCDASLRMAAAIDADILGERVATQHPLVNGRMGERRFSGAFAGGRTNEFLKMAPDLGREDAMNRWFEDNPPDVLLDAGYSGHGDLDLPRSPRLSRGE